MKKKEDHIEIRVKNIADFIIESGATVRKTAMIFGVSKSTVHRDIKVRMPKSISEENLEIINDIMAHNFKMKNIRGGLATRKKYREMEAA